MGVRVGSITGMGKGSSVLDLIQRRAYDCDLHYISSENFEITGGGRVYGKNMTNYKVVLSSCVYHDLANGESTCHACAAGTLAGHSKV